MINGFSNDKVNVNIRYINMPTAMTDKFNISRDTTHVFRIRFNNIFKNEKVMYATIAVLISIFSLIAGYTIYYIYDLYQIDSHPINITNEFALETTTLNDGTSDIDTLLSAGYGANTIGSATPTPLNSYGGQAPNPNEGGVSAITLPRKGRKIIDVEDSSDNSNIAVAVGEKKVIFTLSDRVRSNPFVPYTNAIGRSVKAGYPEPPATLPIANDAEKVMTTTISGILYDQYSPSAILNIQGADYLVKKGDVINKYKVTNISSSTVTVKLGSNVYSAGVGEQINGKLDYNVVSDLSNKFGGSAGIDRMIQNSRERL